MFELFFFLIKRNPKICCDIAGVSAVNGNTAAKAHNLRMSRPNMTSWVNCWYVLDKRFKFLLLLFLIFVVDVCQHVQRIIYIFFFEEQISSVSFD